MHILEWINDDERNRPWSHSEPVLRENYTWMLADNQLIQLGVTDEKVGIVKNYDLHAITGVHADNLYVTDSHLYFRSSKGIFKVPFVKERNSQSGCISQILIRSFLRTSGSPPD